ncbi:hypothetical protein HS048_22345 [Planomonospora sp. ID91781]|uniref:hypothetical protein n=1 Tax=Planomonospora sp. ID91781 TaxID=2738135 RepID=UPI0018C4409D|nr:hypothetical protein [Planomonospora sp. ID91781]MBG0823475.1 hypothetical protein [Planomonospora sp. ID91781]
MTVSTPPPSTPPGATEPAAAARVRPSGESAGEPAVRRPWRVVLLSALAGFLLTVVWSAEFVDRTIGGTVADAVLGRDADTAPITGLLSGIAFSFVTGLAGTFTACNIAALGAVAPLLGAERPLRARLLGTLRPLGWLAAGMLTVSGIYGVVAALAGTGMPQFSTAPSGPGLSPRTVQAMVVFGVIGLILLYQGLAALGIVRDPLERISRRFPHARMVVMGALIGAFLVGRPFGLFRHLFRDTAESHDPLYGALAFMLQSAGNVVVVAVLFLVLALGTGGRVHRWLTARPGRAAVVTGAAFIVAGVFTVLYWDVRILARREIIPWYPTAPWA